MGRFAIAVFSLVFTLSSLGCAGAPQPGDSWPLGGSGLGNQRNNPHVDLDPVQVRGARVAWSKDLAGDAWTQPTVAYGKVFMTDNAGMIYAFDAVTGETIWQRELADVWLDPAAPEELPKPSFAASRTAPAVAFSKTHGVPVLYIGDQAGNPTLVDEAGAAKVPFDGANVYAINANTGELIAVAKVANPEAAPGEDFTVLTGAMTVYNGKLYTGVSGLGEANPNCMGGTCTFRGRVMCFDADTLELLWETYTVPALPYAGASVWASTPAVDPERNQLLVGTGNNFQIPAKIQQCVVAAKEEFATLPNAEAHPNALPAMQKCVENVPEWSENYFDSILALDLDTGAIKWAHKTLLYDVWTLGCISLGTEWPTQCGPDMDFSQHPMVIQLQNDSTDELQDIVAVGQKNGTMFGLDPTTGEMLWKTTHNDAGSRFEPGLVGGWQWGSAFNGTSVIGLYGNSYGVDHDYNSARGSGTTRGGSIVGFNPETGEVRWQTPLTGDSTFVGDPPGTGILNNVVEALFGASLESDDPAAAFGAPSCAGRICFWGSMGENGIILATDTTTGRTIWERPANGSVLWGGAIVQLPEGIFYYVGSGYASFTTGKAAGPGPNFWAYKIPAE